MSAATDKAEPAGIAWVRRNFTRADDATATFTEHYVPVGPTKRGVTYLALDGSETPVAILIDHSKAWQR